MSLKLLVRQGGAAADEVDVVNLDDRPREASPIFDGDAPAITFGMRWEQGTAARGTFMFNDPTALLPVKFRPHASVKLIEDESGDDVIIGWGRIEGGDDVARRTPTGIGGDEVEHQSIQVQDLNLDLRGLPFADEWERPAETSWERLQALQAHKLNGSGSTSPIHRTTTNIRVENFANGHLVDASDPVDLEAVTYPVGTQVNDVMADIFEQWGRAWGVTVHHDGGSHKCLLALEPDDLATFTSALKISDQHGEWNPDHLTAPVLEPNWRKNSGKSTDNSETISGLISRYSGTTDEPRSLTVETGEAPEDWETWWDVYDDDLARSPVQAERRANNVLNDRKRPYSTNQPSILLLPEQVALIVAGQSIQVKSVVVNQGPDKHEYVWHRIAQIEWEPNPDGRWWAHLELDRPRGTRPRQGGGQPGSTTPRFPPTCTPTPDDVVTTLFDSAVGDWGSTITTGSCWGGDPHKSVGGSGATSSAVTVSAGDSIRGSFNFRDQTGDDPWENVDNYNYEGVLRFSKAGGGLPIIEYEIVNQRYHNAGCINVNHSITKVVPAGYDRAQLQLKSRLGGYQFNGTIASVDPGDVPENDPDCVDGGPGGSSPFVPRYDDPRFDADDQHLTSKVETRPINNSGGLLERGDLVIADPSYTDGRAVITTTDAAQTEQRVGVVTDDFDDGETGRVIWEGSIDFPINYGGATPSPLDYVFTSTTAGEADLSGTRAAGAVGQVFLDGDGEVLYTQWWGVPDSSGAFGGDHGSLSGLDDDDHIKYRTVDDGGGDTIQTHAAAGSTETLDLANGNVHDVTLTADCTITLAGATGGVECTMLILLRQGSGAPWDVTWPGSVAWAGGSAPTLQTAEDEWNMIELTTLDGGTVWFGSAEGATGGGGGGGHDITEDGGSPLATRGNLDFRHGLDVTDDSGSDSTRIAVDESELTHNSLGGLTTGDPHTQYRLEADNHTHQSSGAQGGTLDHGLALTGLTDDDHPQYMLEALASAKGELWGASANDTPAMVAASTEGQMLVGRAAATAGNAFETINGAIEVEMDGGGAVIATGIKAYIRIPFALEIVRVSMLGDTSGSMVIDIWRDTFAAFLAGTLVAADSITASAKPTVSGARGSEDTTLTGWSKSCPEGSVLAINVDSVSTFQKMTLEIKYKRS